MSERPTQEIKTPGGRTVILKTYLTAGERRAINAVMAKWVKIEHGGEVDTSGVSGEAALDMKDEMIRQVVVSVDGQAGDVYTLCMDLPEQDYAVVETAVLKVVTPDEKKSS